VERVGAVSALDETALLVSGDGAQFINALNEPCRGARDSRYRIAYATSDSSLCKNDVITLVDIETGQNIRTCRLADFEVVLKTRSGPEHN
jgi:hypothetical protein